MAKLATCPWHWKAETFGYEKNCASTEYGVGSLSGTYVEAHRKSYLTEHFAMFEPRSPAINQFYVVCQGRSPDYGALKLWSVWSGITEKSNKALVLKLNCPSPTNTFTILKLQNPSYNVSKLHKICRFPDRETLKLWKGSSGRWIFN